MAFETDRILIIDDEPQLRQSVRTYLEDSGFEVSEAKDGEEGLTVFRELKPHCVLTDLQMPTLSGLGVLETVRQESPDTPIIVISGQGVMQDAIQALRLGAWDYLLKPIPDMAVLEHAVCRSLERSRLILDNKRYKAEIEAANIKLKKTLETLEEDLTAGRRVQAQLSPPWQAEIGEYHFSFNIEPSLYLSGDYVDYFKINEDYLVFYIADVSGHGASSAFVTVLLKSLVNQIQERYFSANDQTIIEPKAMLSLLSQKIHGAKLGKYLTTVYAVLNLKTHVIKYSIGGHFPNPILYDGLESKYLLGKGFPVGIMAQAKFDEYEVTMTPNSRLVMFSDGILEILNLLELPDKEARLLEIVKNRGDSIPALLDEVKVSQFEALPDDVTLLLLKRTGV